MYDHASPHYSETCRCRSCGYVRNTTPVPGRALPGQTVVRHIHGVPIHEWTVVRYERMDDAYLLECDTPQGSVRRWFKANEVTV